jgi:putative ABC transport system permease protein
MKELGMEKQLYLQPLSSIKTTTGYEVEMSKTISPSFLYILILIAVIIQVIACINFMNLSTARASKRAKEVGVRKVIGASRKDLIKQFLGESFIISLIALVLVLPSLVLGLPYLNSITESDIKVDTISNYQIWFMLGGLVLITGFLAGSYPAFYLSAFRVVKVIKGDFSSHISAAGIRRILVVVQFSLSVVLIAGMVIIYSQLNYINRRDLGFDKSQKLVFSFHTEEAKAKMPAFIDDLRQMAEVKSVSRSNNYLSQFVFNDQGVFLAGGNMANAPDAMNMTTDENFVKANGITIIGGRDFSITDSGKVLINETLAKRLGLNPKTAAGTLLYTQYAPDPAMSMEIAGVMKDFNFSSLHEEVKPFMLKCNPKDNYLSNITVATSSTNYKNLLGQIETLWHKNFPAVPFRIFIS